MKRAAANSVVDPQAVAGSKRITRVPARYHESVDSESEKETEEEDSPQGLAAPPKGSNPAVRSGATRTPHHFADIRMCLRDATPSLTKASVIYDLWSYMIY